MFRHDKKHAEEEAARQAEQADKAETPFKEPLSQVAEEIGGGWPEDEESSSEDTAGPPVIPQPGQPPLAH